jgi:hypothetical protein
MTRSISAAAHWLGRHAFPAIAATVVAVGAAGGGIGYAVASQPATAAPASPTSSAGNTTQPAAATLGGRRPMQVFQRALTLLAADTGQTVVTVRGELAAGKSVDQIAGAKAPAIESKILAQLTKLAARAVSAGRMTAAQETTGLAMAKTTVAALMAEPGTKLLQDAQNALQFLQRPGRNHVGSSAATPTPTP